MQETVFHINDKTIKPLVTIKYKIECFFLYNFLIYIHLQQS